MWYVAMAFIFSIVFELVSQQFFGKKSTDAQTASGHQPGLGERRDTEVGHKRYYDEDEIDVGLGLVEEGDTTGSKFDLTTVNILYCIG